MRHSLSILAAACIAAGAATPAAAQLFQVPSQRTIVLSPGWHLDGPPVRSSDGLRFAVRSDAGAMRDMTVMPNGAITFADKPRKVSEPERRAKVSEPERKAKAVATDRRARAPVRQIGDAGRAKPEDSPKAKPEDSPKAKPEDSPKKVTAKLESNDAPAATPAAAASIAAPAPRRGPEPAPAPIRTGPGFAHGVPINPLD